jgi:amino acid permease
MRLGIVQTHANARTQERAHPNMKEQSRMTESQVNASTADTDAAESAEAEQGGLERKMETRHLTMISL